MVHGDIHKAGSRREEGAKARGKEWAPAVPEGRLLGAATQHSLPFFFLPGLTYGPHLTTKEVRQLFSL